MSPAGSSARSPAPAAGRPWSGRAGTRGGPRAAIPARCRARTGWCARRTRGPGDPGRPGRNPAGQLLHGGHDAHIRCIRNVTAADFCGQLTQVSGPHVPGPGGPRHHERQVFGPDPLRQQGHRSVPEDQRRRYPVGHHRRGGHDRGGDRGMPRAEQRGRPRPRTPARPGPSAGGSRAGQPARRSPPPPPPARPGRSGPRPSRAGRPGPRWSRSAARAGGSHPGAAGPGPPPPTPPAIPRRRPGRAGGPQAPVAGQRRPGHAADDRGRDNLPPPLPRLPRLAGFHDHNVPAPVFSNQQRFASSFKALKPGKTP